LSDEENGEQDAENLIQLEEEPTESGEICQFTLYQECHPDGWKQ